MLQLLVDLIAIRLRYEPVPVDLLHVLAMVLIYLLTVVNWLVFTARPHCSQCRALY